MKLTLDKKWGRGSVQVRGGRFVKVALDHQVNLIGWDRNQPRSENEPPQFAPDQKWTTAKVGDLAAEVVAVKTGKVLGHAYLNGAAVRCVRYSPALESWFTEATAVRVDLTAADTPEKAVGMIFGLRTAPADLALFELAEAADVGAAMEFIASWIFATNDLALPETRTADILGVITGRGKKRRAALIHDQRNMQPWAATLFHAQLALTSAHWTPLEWTEAALNGAA